jgi:hypothetical protein
LKLLEVQGPIVPIELPQFDQQAVTELPRGVLFVTGPVMARATARRAVAPRRRCARLLPQSVCGACACSACVKQRLRKSASSPPACTVMRACPRSIRAHSRLYHPTRRSGAGAYQPRACRVRDATSFGHSTCCAHAGIRLSSVAFCAYPSAAAAPNERVRCLLLTRRSPHCRQPPPPCAPRGRLLCAPASLALGAPCSSRRRSGTQRSA